MTTPHTTSGAADLPEALRLAAWLNEGAWHKMRLGDVLAAGLELRRLHALAAAAPTQPTRIECKVYKGSPEHREYLSARFPWDGSSKSNSFEWQGHRWAYQYTSFNDAGEYDLIWRPATPEAAPVEPAHQPVGAGEQSLRNAFAIWAETQGTGEVSLLDVLSPIEIEAAFDDWKLTLVAASAPAPTRPESLHTFLNAAAAEGYVLNGVDAADLYVELFPERYVAALEWFHSGMHEASAEAAPVAPAPQPAVPNLTLEPEMRAAMQEAFDAESVPVTGHKHDSEGATASFIAACERAFGTSAAPVPVAEDAANWHWLASYLVGPRTDLDDEIVASESVNDLRKLVSAARAQAAQPEGGA